MVSTYLAGEGPLARDRPIAAQTAFFVGMDAIVFRYDQEANGRVESAKAAAAILLSVMLLVLLAQGIFVFHPTVRSLSASLAELKRHESELERTVEMRTAESASAVGKLEDANRLLARAALRDDLTQLANRRVLDQVLDAEHKRAERNGDWLSVVLIDVDHFKRYNDRYGHQAGDRCPQQIAAALATCATRPSDLVARYGGEEFAMILPNTTPEGARQICDDALAAVRMLEIAHESSEVASIVTISPAPRPGGPTPSR